MPAHRPPHLSNVAAPETIHTVGGDKPTSFADAFLHFGFPDALQSPRLTMVDATIDDVPATLADLPFDTFQQAVVGSFFLEDGTPPSLMQQAQRDCRSLLSLEQKTVRLAPAGVLGSVSSCLGVG